MSMILLMRKWSLIFVIFFLKELNIFANVLSSAQFQIVHFKNNSLSLGGELYTPPGLGPFPVILYNHGSAPGMLNSDASKFIAPHFIAKGWAFFMPYRRGQGLSSEAGPFVGDEIKLAHKKGGSQLASKKLVELMTNDHLSDQMAAFDWLKSQKIIDAQKIAVGGNSFGGIQAVLGAARISYCAAFDASGAAESWNESPELQKIMKEAVRHSKAPIFFFQAQNDFDLSPTHILSAEMKRNGKMSELKIYPPFGKSNKEGHSFAYRGSSIWFKDVFSFIQKNCK